MRETVALMDRGNELGGEALRRELRPPAVRVDGELNDVLVRVAEQPGLDDLRGEL